MALLALQLPMPHSSAPQLVRRLIDEANQRIEDFVRDRGERPLAGFVPSDFDQVYRAILALSQDRGGCFVEWGSGFGVPTLLAASVGFDASGIEIQPELVEESERLALDFEIDAEFVCGSYVPAVAQDLIDFTDGPDWLEPGGQDGHALLDLAPSDIDIVFAYPWPGETKVMANLFQRLTCPGSILLTWNGIEGIQIHEHRPQRECH